MTAGTAPWAPSYPIRTARLLLRPHLESDLDDLVPFHSDPEITRYIPWPVRNREETQLALAAKLDKGTVTAEGEWLILAIVHAAENRVIGEVLLKRVSDSEGVGELGYALARSHQGQGLAVEAAQAVLALAFGEFALERVIARIDEPNLASRRMIERLGFTEVSRSEPNPEHGENEILVNYSVGRDAAAV